MSNSKEHEVQDQPSSSPASEDAWMDRLDEEADRFEDYAEQQLYANTDFKPAAGWY